MLEAVVVASFLAVLTVVVAVFYGRRINEARREYVKAKSAVDDIVLSFNRQLHSQEERLGITAQKVDVLSSRNELLAEKVEMQKTDFKALTEKTEPLPSVMSNALTRIDSVESKLNEFTSLKESLEQKIVELERRRFRPKEPEARVESAIPIRRERALAQLTETELLVLEFLATEGEKTAPEIRERVKLSREHTARLMKKLYEKGYVERSSNKIPFMYRLKEEMQRFLKKPEQKS
ncbi:MAG: helix-turn-helix domain-containing protein [Candidatus Bathyarchaeia archaeon]